MWTAYLDRCRRQSESWRRSESIAILLLRLVIGFGFMVHGWAKLSRGPDKFAQLLVYLDIPAPGFMAWLVTISELIGGLMMILGAFVLVLSIPLIIIHLVAMFGIHIHYGFSSVNTIGLSTQGPLFGPPVFEISLLYISGILALSIFGAGALSIDGLCGKAARKPLTSQTQIANHNSMHEGEKDA